MVEQPRTVIQELTPSMGTDFGEVEKTLDSSCSMKVHGAMCTQLKTLIDRILGIFPKLEEARPRCSSGIQALCRLQDTIETAKNLLDYCSKSSRFYLAITGDKIVSMFKRAKQQLENDLSELQTMVPMTLELEISQIVDDLRRTVFIIGPSEQEAAKVLKAILQQDESILISFHNSKIRAFQFVASRIHLTSQKDLLIEKREIHKMLDRVSDADQPKKIVLTYLKCLLEKHGKLILEGQTHYTSINHDESFFPAFSVKRSVNDLSVDTEAQLKTHEEQGISSNETSSLDISSNSISSCGSLAGLNLQIDVSNLSLGSEDTSYNSGNFHSKFDDDDLGSSSEFKFFSSKHELETTLLSNISLLPWESQLMAIEDVQNYLDCCNHISFPISSKNFVEPLVVFLKASVQRQDENSQTIATRLLSTGAHISRSAIQFIDEDVYLLLSSFLGTAMTKDVLAIFQSSVQRNCGTKLVQSGALNSILKILDTQYKEFHESAIKLLYNLSSTTEDRCLLRYLPVECISKLSPLLKDTSLAGPCIQIMEKLCYTKEARLLAIETKECISSIVELLDTGSCEEREHGVSILLTLCSQCNECCRLIIEEGILSTLACIQVSGNERGRAGAFELYRILNDFTEEDEEEEKEDSSYDRRVSRSPPRNSEGKTFSKKNGMFSKLSAKLKGR